MVCVPCIVFPILLWLFYMFIRPWMSYIWSRPDEIARNCENNLTCPLPKKRKKKDHELLDEETTSSAENTDPSSSGLSSR